MSKILKVSLLALVLFVSCFCPFLCLNAGPDHALPAEHTLANGAYGTGEILPPATANNGSSSSQLLPLLIFALFLYVSFLRQSKIKPPTRSVIPALRSLLFLYPIHFQSNYIPQLPARL